MTTLTSRSASIVGRKRSRLTDAQRGDAEIHRRRHLRWYQLDSDRAFWLFCVFAAAVFLTGGGSRADISSLGLLRAFSAVLLALAVFLQNDRSLRRIAVPLAIAGGLALCIAIQLIPLPPEWWSALPARESIARAGELAGVADTWRPITLSPMKTANSLASLVVPVTGLMLAGLLDENGWRRLPWVLIVAGVASAVLGIAQILLPMARGLYLYEITNTGSAVGLFSNRNHNAMFLSLALLACTFRLEQVGRGRLSSGDVTAILAVLLILAGLLINASRAGLVGMGLVGMIYSFRALLRWRAETRSGDRRGATLRAAGGGIVALGSLAMVGLFAVLGRSPAIARLLAEDPAQDQRVEALPTVLGMLGELQPFGAGFGAFEYAYRMNEPLEQLGPRYLNNAHNDWLQFPLEGGVPAIVLGLVVLALLLMRTSRIIRMRPKDGMQRNAVLGMLVLGLLALGSAVDYPLRTPSLMLVAALACAMMFKPIASQSRPPGSGGAR